MHQIQTLNQQPQNPHKRKTAQDGIMKVIIEGTDKEIADLILQLQRSAELDDSKIIEKVMKSINEKMLKNSDRPFYSFNHL